jgi:hypothetical protein
MSDRVPALKSNIKQLVKGITNSPFARRLIATILTFLILIPTILLILRPPKVAAVWFDDNYAIRQKFSFTHNTDITSERRISFSLDTATLITAGVMQSDCDDTRFTDLNGKVLRYNLTGPCNNAATAYDVVFPSIIDGINIGYVYYGNPRAVSASQDDSDVPALTPSGGNPSISSRTNEEKAPSPALFLMFDEGYGSTTQDASSNNNNGGVRGAAWKTKEWCLAANCLGFDGVDDTVIATNAATIALDQGLAAGFTVQAWIRVDATGENSVGQLFNKGTNTYLRVTNASNGRADLEAKLDLGTTDATVTISQGIELHRWMQVTMAYTDDADDEITLYVNGINKGSSTNGSGAPGADTNDLVIGGPNQAHFKGFIDEFKIYPYERTSDQIKSDAGVISSIHGTSASVGGNDSYLSDGLVGYWKMDEGSGTSTSDSSGTGNTGTLTNGPAWTSGKFAQAVQLSGGGSSGTAWDISAAAYDSLSKSVAAQEANPFTVVFKPDGTKMYMVGNTNDTVYQYSLSTAWDVSTASYDSLSKSVAAQETTPNNIAFKPDGTKMYMVGNVNDTVYQYSLSTAWDVSTASYDSLSKSVAAQDISPNNIAFKSDGTKMYMLGSGTDTVYQYTLTTAWDVSTASYDSLSKSVTAQDTGPFGLAFKSDGTKMYMVGNTNNTVYQYTLTTAWDVSTASYDSVSKSVAAQETSPFGFAFKSDGTKMYMLGPSTDTVYQYTLSTSLPHVFIGAGPSSVKTVAFWVYPNTTTQYFVNLTGTTD